MLRNLRKPSRRDISADVRNAPRNNLETYSFAGLGLLAHLPGLRHDSDLSAHSKSVHHVNRTRR